MLEAEDILSGLLRGAIGGRGKRWRRTRRALDGGGLLNAGALLGAAGVAWGLYETWQQQKRVKGAASPAASGPPPLSTPPPLPSAHAPAPEDPGLPPSILRLLRLMVSAARADGEIAPAERERILAEAREVGALEAVEAELALRRPLAEIVAGAEDPTLKEQMYALAFTIVRSDDDVSGGERIYLAQLAHQLGLEAATVARLEAEVVRRIEAAGAGA